MTAKIENATPEQIAKIEKAGFKVTNPTISEETTRPTELVDKTLLNGNIFVGNGRLDVFAKIIGKFSFKPKANQKFLIFYKFAPSLTTMK